MARRHTRVLRLTGDDRTVEIHILKPGERIANFWPGGQDLVARKTPSLAVMRTSPEIGRENIEYDVHDPYVWQWIARMINGETDLRADEGEHLP